MLNILDCAAWFVAGGFTMGAAILIYSHIEDEKAKKHMRQESDKLKLYGAWRERQNGFNYDKWEEEWPEYEQEEVEYERS